MTLERTRRDIKTDGVSADNRTAFAFGGVSGLVTVGGQWYDDKQTGRDSAGVDGTEAGVPNGKDTLWGTFVQAEANVDHPLGAPGKLTLIPAVRYDSYRNSSTGYPDTRKTAVSPKLALTDLYASWSPGDEILGAHLQGLRIDAGVDNVTDRDYAPYQAGVSAPGRNFKVLASYTARF